MDVTRDFMFITCDGYDCYIDDKGNISIEVSYSIADGGGADYDSELHFTVDALRELVDKAKIFRDRRIYYLNHKDN